MEIIARSSWTRAIVLILILIAVGYAIMQTLAGNREDVEIGKKAPNFTLTNLQGETVQLSDYRGSGVLLNFWASWCDPCVNEMPLLNETYQRLPGVEILAVNMGEAKEKVSQFADRYHLQFPILLDQQSDVKKRYKIGGLPATFLIDDKGHIVEKISGELDSSDFIMNVMERIQPKPERK
ncbi:thiol-disulfide oxidoreductase ResA [Paenibacillus profundus]|uniref:Thiol-disulfide oxidoreductase ResA n=1 Tax=Paenibacillus profundus TaxID=1173085 RepID=A0ABS8YK36_9BACL|nr:thiol-disulfide oxidoreductase ResA [Paenibacillus profundus]MCE5170715.1 thiol-disulfide oxidoreductase ResA [Paenibacillus profundus]